MSNKTKMNIAKLKAMKVEHQKIVCLTAYDASIAYWADGAGVDVILVGDSLGMVVQGHETTLPVTLSEMVYHAQMVQRKNQFAWCIADLPFMADATLEKALAASKRLMKESLINMVKLEGGRRVLSIVEKLSELGIPVCGHLGLLPQSVEKNGYRVAGKDQVSASQLLEDAVALEQAGADMLVLECVPSALAKTISETLMIPVIGIGSGKDTDGQVLVVTDILGLTVGKTPKFSKNFLIGTQGSIQQAIANYASEVRTGLFPSKEQEIA